MQRLNKRILNFLRSEDGPTAVEYGIMLAVIIAVCLLSIKVIGTKTSNSFNTAANTMGT